MVNENTLRILQDIGYGADLDSLESYLIDFEKASKVSNLDRHSYNYSVMRKLFKELKPDSKIFDSEYDTEEELKEDKFARLFEQYGNIHKAMAYGVLDNLATSDIKEKIDKMPDNVSDILALVEIQGLDCMCTYKDGYICKVYLIGESKRYLDITSIMLDRIPRKIKELADHELVELRGKLTSNSKRLRNLSLHLETAIMHALRTEIYLEDLDIIFNDIISDTLEFSTQWDKMEFMQIMPIETAPFVMVRSIDSTILQQAIVDIDASIQTMEIPYETYGFEVKLNTYMDNTTGFKVVMDDADYRKEYESTVKSIATDDSTNMQVLKIVNTQCNKRFNIDKIYISDIYKLEEYGITIGSKIKFKVIDGKAVIV